MNETQAFLTQEKFEELKKELDHLKTVRRKEVAESLEYARSLGDLSENAEYQEARDDGYFHRELFWGSFSRTLLLPEEVAIDEADAKEKHGMLEIRLPKLDKHRSTQLRVKSGAHK